MFLCVPVAALKMAVHGGQPGSYAGYVITKLTERLHAAKHWLVRAPEVASSQREP